MSHVSDVVAPYLAQRLIGEATQVLAEPWLIPKSWKWAKMGDVTTIVGGGTPKTSVPAYFGGDIPWVTPADLSGYTDKYIDRGARNITEAGLANSGARLMPAGTVLFSSRAPIGYVAIASQAVATNQGFKSFVLKDELLPDFVYYWLLCAKPIAIKLASGTTFLEISGKKAAEIPIPVPPLDEQRRVVAEIEERLSRLEAGVAALKRVQVNLKRYRAAALRSVFTGGSGSNELPHGWKWTTLGGQFYVGVGATPSRKEPTYWGGSIPWVSSGEVQFCRIRETSEHITDHGLGNSSTRINPRGSVLLAMIGQGRTRGQAAILEIEAANNQNCAALWVGETETPPEFVYYWLMSEYEATRQVGSGNNQQALNKSLVQALPIPWPPLAEQRKIVTEIERRLSVVEETETQVRADLARAERLRQATLARAFAPGDRSR